jgi:DNA replication protein DnaC
MKPTVVISNLAKEALGEFIGERSIDRLRENGGRLVVFDWASYRRQVA